MRNTGPVVPLYDGILFVHRTTPDQNTALTEAYLATHPDADEDGWRVIDGPVNVGPHHLHTDDEGTQYVPGPGPEGVDTFTGAVVHTALVNEDTITFRPDGTAYRKYAANRRYAPAMDGIVHTAEQIVVLEAARAYVDGIGPTDMTDPGKLAGHLMQAEVLLTKIADAFTQTSHEGS